MKEILIADPAIPYWKSIFRGLRLDNGASMKFTVMPTFKTALEGITSNAYQAVISEFMDPLSGEYFYENLLREASIKGMPYIVVTNHSTDVKALLDSHHDGMKGYYPQAGLHKRLRPDQLISRIEAILCYGTHADSWPVRRPEPAPSLIQPNKHHLYNKSLKGDHY